MLKNAIQGKGWFKVTHFRPPRNPLPWGIRSRDLPERPTDRPTDAPYLIRLPTLPFPYPPSPSASLTTMLQRSGALAKLGESMTDDQPIPPSQPVSVAANHKL